MVDIKFLQTHPEAILPSKNDPNPETGDVGYDLFATETTIIPPRGNKLVPVGLKLGYITPGYWFRIEARSGNGFKKKLEPHFGVIDNSYKGNLGILLFSNSDFPQTIEKGKGVAQFVVYEMIKSKISWIEEKDIIPTVRGEKGFGSSDK